MAHDDTPPRICSFIFEGHVPNIGAVAVVIDGVHDTEADDFCGLNYERIPVLVTDEGLVVIEDTKLGNELLELATSYLYMTEGDIVTSDAQIVRVDAQRFQLDVAGHGLITIVPVGVIAAANDVLDSEDHYQLAIANPSPGTYLVIILEIIGTDPLEFRAIDLEDEELVDGIITEYLEQIGAIESDGENEAPEEEAGDEDSEDSTTAEDDTVAPGQHWTAVTDIEEA